MIPPDTLGFRETDAVFRVLRSGRLGPGPQVEAFESEAARFLGVRGAAATGSGSAALALTLRALGAGPGKEVILPAYARPSLLHAVRLTGAVPVPADVLWHDMNLSVVQVRRRLTHRTAAVAAAHAFGASVELEPLLKLGVPVVEEVSEVLGAVDYNRRKLGTFGSAAVAAFGAGGLMTSGGEGGMVFSDDRRLLDAVRAGRSAGTRGPSLFRLESEMTDLQAAVGRVQLARLPSFLAARRKWSDRYRAGLAGLPLEAPLQVYGRVYHTFVVKFRRSISEALLQRFKTRGVAVSRPLSRPLHWDSLPAGAFPVSDRLWRRCLSLPLHPALTESDFRRVLTAVRRVVS